MTQAPCRNSKLGCDPLHINAARLLLANRDPICWCEWDFAVRAEASEEFGWRDGYTELEPARTHRKFVPDPRQACPPTIPQ